MRSIPFFAIFLSVGCMPERLEDEVDANPLPAFVEDCESASNETVETASGLVLEDGKTWTELDLCDGDVDVYRIDIPPGFWAAVTLDIDGNGKRKRDLDLWALESPDRPIPASLDMVEESGDLNVVWASATEQPTERLAWYNDTGETLIQYLAVAGYDGANADYDLRVNLQEFYDGMDCDEYVDDTRDRGPCNTVMQFPQAMTEDHSYLVSHPTHYSALRREVIMLVRYAAAETAAAFEDTNPIGLLDMSQPDGDTPGRWEGRLRHPEGTHVEGNDIDVAYYQTGSDNLGRSVCQENGYFCTSEPHILDARRSAFFIAKLMESPYLRVIGVDTMIAPMLEDAIDDLYEEGLVERKSVNRMGRNLAYGDGWPFHQHHLHFSWSWEGGNYTESFESDAASPQDAPGCLLQNLPEYEAPLNPGFLD